MNKNKPLPFIDQLGREINISSPPQRIVSLVPSITELLAHYNLEEEVVGLTKFCVFPEEWFRSKKRIGGTKTVNFEAIEALQPDLILANKEENTKAEIDQLKATFPVWISDVKSVEDALQLNQSIGRITNKIDASNSLNKQIKERLNKVVHRPTRKVAYMIWQEPLMVAGGDTYINSMLNLGNFKNVFEGKKRYPVVSAETLALAQPDEILLSSEPFPFREKHIEFYKEICPQAVIRLIDGTYFSWYGSRLLPAINYIGKL